jgi:hypothetical protein
MQFVNRRPMKRGGRRWNPCEEEVETEVENAKTVNIAKIAVCRWERAVPDREVVLKAVGPPCASRVRVAGIKNSRWRSCS